MQKELDYVKNEKNEILNNKQNIQQENEDIKMEFHLKANEISAKKHKIEDLIIALEQ